jgi:uncharacterized protein (DUF2252 family)
VFCTIYLIVASLSCGILTSSGCCFSSNFGAWRNRGGEVVFSVNDFDEAAIYDFHIDVLRIAVSIW